MPYLAFRRRPVILLSIVWLAGVAQAGETCNFGMSANNGIVVFSGSIPDQFARAKWLSSFRYIYNSAGGIFLADRVAELRSRNLLGRNQSDVAAGYTRIFILRLSAGDYEFRRWEFRFGGVVFTPRNIKPLKFTVAPGRATYLGSLESSGYPENTPLTVRDQHDRDLSVFSTKCPTFDPSQIDVKIMDPAPWVPTGNSP